MSTITIYLSVVVLLFVSFSTWIGLTSPQADASKQRLKSCLSVTMEVTVCSLAYSVFFFVFMLAVGIGIWLILLGLVYLPADLLNNAFGDTWTSKIVNTILPYVSRSNRSPGLLGQPILDYSTLCVLAFAPISAMWTVFSNHKRRPTVDPTPRMS